MLRLFPSFMRFPILYLLIGVIGFAVVHAAPAPVDLDDHSSSLSSPPSPVAETQRLVSRARQIEVYYDNFIEKAPYILSVILNSEMAQTLNLGHPVKVVRGINHRTAEWSTSPDSFSGSLVVKDVLYSFYASEIADRPEYWDFSLVNERTAMHRSLTGISVTKSAVAQAEQLAVAQAARRAQRARDADTRAERARLANRLGSPLPNPGPIPERPHYGLSNYGLSKDQMQRLKDRQRP
ncbi:hypothetical protein F5878DRAFT_707670 [Lentinula raphanica]|uniref:Uncharacterized protein n=1 Tax=Lentinula raphanica TaxID=153919 RepID=A0AA38UKS3_9AGAR|nr:hypothetical protein F5878DRAFT_707670 [Lentinula raphanica]